MKSRDIPGLMVNPFTRIAGLQAFAVGLVFILLMGIIGTYSRVSFDGALDMHIGNQQSLLHSFSLLAIDLVCIVSIMWVTGLIISKGFRFVDILGTMTLAKAPLIILAVAGYFTKSPDLTAVLNDPAVLYHSTSFILVTILSVPVSIWSIVLMYHALKISCDVKGNKLAFAFIIAVLVSEIISKILILKLV
ncbi:MAG: hypothetical protein Q8904_05225 [Bacteroidota bacterium]|nr:hypothetical protein [Bacteroidota bacterium]